MTGKPLKQPAVRPTGQSSEQLLYGTLMKTLNMMVILM
jgi:hypothetical protein